MYQPAPDPERSVPVEMSKMGGQSKCGSKHYAGWIPKWIPVPENLPRQSLHSQDFPADNMDMTPFSKIQQKGQI